MRKLLGIVFIGGLLSAPGLFAQEAAPAVPAETAAPLTPAAQPEKAVPNATAPDATAAPQAQNPEDAALAKDLEAAQSGTEKTDEGFVTTRESVQQEKEVVSQKPKVMFNPRARRDPTLSPDDFLLIQYREQQRLAAIEAERQRRLAEERRRKEAEERQRQLELARLKDPTREVRNKIKIGGIIGQEVFIGNKIYTIGDKIFGARIVAVEPESVVFSYKGHKFVRQVKL